MGFLMVSCLSQLQISKWTNGDIRSYPKAVRVPPQEGSGHIIYFEAGIESRWCRGRRSGRLGSSGVRGGASGSNLHRHGGFTPREDLRDDNYSPYRGDGGGHGWRWAAEKRKFYKQKQKKR